MRVFTLIWFGQLISLIGSGLTRFALGVWVYQNTGSVTQFALISLFAMLPSILISPVVGVLVDRWNRRSCMILSDAGAGLSTLAIALLLFSGKLEVWHIYVAVAVSSIFSAFQWPAYAAATTMLVPKQHLGRANGMVQLAEAASRLLSPMLAGALVVTIQIQGVILIDCVSFLFSLVTLLLVRFPKPKTTPEDEVRQSWRLREFTYGWTYITARPGLLGLLIFFAVINFFIGVVSVLVTPLVLAFASATVLGTVLSIGGSGMLVGGLVMSAWGGPKKRILSVFGFTLSGGLSILLAGLMPSVPVFFAAAFIYYFGVSMINGCDQAIWQSKVAPAVQGRVFAVRSMLALASLPLAYLIAGPLVDQVFEPLLAVSGPLAGSIGRIIGVGRGHGIGLLFVVMGMLTMLATAGGYLYLPLRLLEEQLPDA
ncbi:MFS transporter [Brasilonema octagenarum]|uniref:MFS transporter n=1 Tax=Brasilonema octagenarum UFV-OR1 TaxID=417115 RepID=A0ABX1MBU6_9CYAN|nr:MFS transporter [Brasilonema octagenarum]NMF64888.1 MFS transporter [Brasilonema octagenarum UFV-OR1]